MRRFALALALEGACLVASGCAQIFGIDPPNGVAEPLDATADSTAPDSTAGPDGGVDAAGDALDALDASMVDVAVDAPLDAHDAAPVCDLTKTWDPMFKAAITPPLHMFGLDFHGADDAGVTISEVAAAACEVIDAGDTAPGLHVVTWGDAGQATFIYDRASGRYFNVVMNTGYTGAVDFTVPDGGSTYHFALGAPITKDGAPYQLDWTGTPDGGRTLTAEATELENAMFATFEPGTPASTNCKADKTCIVNLGGNGPGTGVFGVRAPLGFYLGFNDVINHPNEPSFFYAFTPFVTYGDFTQASRWTSFDTTQIASNVAGFAGAEFDSLYLYLVPSGAATPVVRYDPSTEAFTSAASGWQKFDITQLTPGPQGFSGSTFDPNSGFVYLAGTTGVCVQYETAAAFSLPASWLAFDTTKLSPPAKGFAGATFLPTPASGDDMVFVPAQDGVAALFTSSGLAADFTNAPNWQTFNLATVDPRLVKFRGGVTVGPSGAAYAYLIPNSDTLVVRWDSTQAFNVAASWEKFDLASVTGAFAGSYATGVYDGQYLYLSPGTGGGPAVRYNPTLPFATAGSWQTGLDKSINKTTATAWDGRYVYFSGSNSTITRYDTTKSFTSDPSAWSSVDVSQLGFPNAVAFLGNTGDGRYLYFAPDTFSTVMRYDARFPQAAVGRLASFSTY